MQIFQGRTEYVPQFTSGSIRYNILNYHSQEQAMSTVFNIQTCLSSMNIKNQMFKIYLASTNHNTVRFMDHYNQMSWVPVDNPLGREPFQTAW